MKSTQIILFALLFGFLISCDKDEDVNVIKMRINHYQQPINYQELYMGLSIIVQENNEIGTDIWHPLLNNIKDFEYELGYIYDIEVIKESVDPPLIDGPNANYTLLKIKSKTKVPAETTFEITLAINYDNLYYESFVTKDEEQNFSLYGISKINCGGLCNDLSKNLENQNGIIGVFNHIDNNTIQLIELKPFSN